MSRTSRLASQVHLLHMTEISPLFAEEGCKCLLSCGPTLYGVRPVHNVVDGRAQVGVIIVVLWLHFVKGLEEPFEESECVWIRLSTKVGDDIRDHVLYELPPFRDHLLESERPEGGGMELGRFTREVNGKRAGRTSCSNLAASRRRACSPRPSLTSPADP